MEGGERGRGLGKWTGGVLYGASALRPDSGVTGGNPEEGAFTWKCMRTYHETVSDQLIVFRNSFQGV